MCTTRTRKTNGKHVNEIMSSAEFNVVRDIIPKHDLPLMPEIWTWYTWKESRSVRVRVAQTRAPFQFSAHTIFQFLFGELSIIQIICYARGSRGCIIHSFIRLIHTINGLILREGQMLPRASVFFKTPRRYTTNPQESILFQIVLWLFFLKCSIIVLVWL